MEVMASTSASSTSLSAASDPFDVESDIDSETELTEESETTQNKTVVSFLHRLKSPTAAETYVGQGRRKRMILLVVNAIVEVRCRQIQREYLPANRLGSSRRNLS